MKYYTSLLFIFINGYVFSQKLTYPNQITFYIEPIHFIHDQEASFSKDYRILNVIQTILFDQLSLQKQIYVDDLLPIEILYRYQQKNFVEDPQINLKTKNLKVKKKIRINFKQVNEPVTDSINNFYLRQKIKYNLQSSESDIEYTLFTQLVKNDKIIIDKKFIIKESKLNIHLYNIVEEVRKIINKTNYASLKIISKKYSPLSVYLNGNYVGISNLELKYLQVGKYALYIKGEEKFKSIKKNITLKPYETFVWDITHLPLQTYTDYHIQTAPPGAKVYIDLIYKGITPLKFKYTKNKNSFLKLKKKGYYPYTTQIQKDQHLFFKLYPIDSLYLEKKIKLYHSLHWTSLIFSILNLGTSIYFFIDRENIKRKLISELSTNNPDLYTQTDLNQISAATKTQDLYLILGATFLSLSVLSFIGTIIFYIKKLQAKNAIYKVGKLFKQKKISFDIKTSISKQLLSSQFLVSYKF